MTKRSSESERLARRRLGYITPMSAGKVLAHPRYWSLAFLKLYLDACDEAVFHCPEEGYLLGQPAAELARRTDIGAGGYDSEQERREWRIRALAVWGSCCRAHGQLTEAQAAYGRAFELVAAAARPISAAGLGELQVRYGVFCLSTGSPQALDHLDLAVGLFQSARAGQRLADALAIRGLVRYLAGDTASLEDLAQALKWLEPRTARGRRTLVSVLHNMALAISRGGMTTEAQELAYRLLTHTQRQIQRPRSVQKIKMIWLEGLLLARLGITRLAEKRLLKAYSGIREQGQLQELAAISMDLVCFYLNEGDRHRAEGLADEAYDRVLDLCQQPGDSPELRAAAESWRHDLSFNGSKALQEKVYYLTFGASLNP